MSRFTRPAALVALLSGVVLFEGFDTNVASIVLPFVGRDFGVGPGDLGQVLSVVGLGAILAFPVIGLADRFGRRPVLLWSVFGFSLATLVTAFTQNAVQFTLVQTLARLLLVTQLTLSYIILSETLSADVRGRANGVMGAFASIGAAVPAVLLPLALQSGAGWRLLFAVGAFPLLLLPILHRYLPEPEREQAVATVGLGDQLRRLWSADLRRPFVTMSALWFLINFWTATAVAFFAYYVFQERGWQARDLAAVAPFALGFAFAGYVVAGQLMDRIGRRSAALLFFITGIAATVGCYGFAEKGLIIACWLMVQMMIGIWVIGYVMTAEMFPADVRASATAVTNNLIGRWGMVFAPLLLGAGGEYLGSVGRAAMLLAALCLVAVPLLLRALPRGEEPV